MDYFTMFSEDIINLTSCTIIKNMVEQNNFRLDFGLGLGLGLLDGMPKRPSPSPEGLIVIKETFKESDLSSW